MTDMGLQKIIDFARVRHDGQFRRDGVTPYWTHIEAVMRRVNGENELILAAIHDLAEDYRATFEEMREFGIPVEIIGFARVLTRHGLGEPYEAYIQRIKQSHQTVINVKIADLLANLSDSPTTNQIVRYSAALLRLV